MSKEIFRLPLAQLAFTEAIEIDNKTRRVIYGPTRSRRMFSKRVSYFNVIRNQLQFSRRYDRVRGRSLLLAAAAGLQQQRHHANRDTTTFNFRRLTGRLLASTSAQ